MTLTEAIALGFDVKIKTGWRNDNFACGMMTLWVNISKYGDTTGSYIQFSEELLNDNAAVVMIIDRTLDTAYSYWTANCKICRDTGTIQCSGCYFDDEDDLPCPDCHGKGCVLCPQDGCTAYEKIDPPLW